MSKWANGQMGKWANGQMGKWANGQMGKWANSRGARPCAPTLTAEKPLVSPYWGLLLGAVAISFAAIFVRLAAAPPLVTGAYRLAIATLLLMPWTVRSRVRAEWARLTRREWLLAGVAGALLSLHFASWIASLSYTTVAGSVVLVTTYPLFVALASPVLLHEEVTRRAYFGIILAIAGSAIIGAGNFAGDNILSSRALFGDLLALIGSLAIAGYFVSGRRLRGKLSLVSYTFVVYGVAALLLLGACILTRQPFAGYPARAYVMFALLATIPQHLGHSAFNWALEFLPAAFVVTPVLAEPVGASLLAYLILQEVPTQVEIIGGALTIVGIFIVARAQSEVF